MEDIAHQVFLSCRPQELTSNPQNEWKSTESLNKRMPVYWVSHVDSGIRLGTGGGRKGDGPGILHPSVTCEKSTLSPCWKSSSEETLQTGREQTWTYESGGWPHLALKWRHHCTKNGTGTCRCHALSTFHGFSTESLQWLWTSPFDRWGPEAQWSLVICSRPPNKGQDTTLTHISRLFPFLFHFPNCFRQNTNIYNCQQRQCC